MRSNFDVQGIAQNKQVARDLVDTVRDRSQDILNLLARCASDASKLDHPDLQKTLQPLQPKLSQYET